MFQVSLAAMVVFSYASLLPAGLYGVMWWSGAGQVSSSTISFIELLCLYGYSLTIYIPVSLLWLIPVSINNNCTYRVCHKNLSIILLYIMLMAIFL